MKKPFIALVVIIPVLFIALYLVAGTIIGTAIKAGVEAFVPQITQTSVTMDKVSISPLTGSGGVEKFVLGNPEGYQTEYSISLGSAEMKVAPFSVLGDHIVIKRIYVKQPSFNYERKLLTSNIKEILNNVQAATEREKEAEATESEDAQRSGVRIEIKELIIEEGQVSFGAIGASVPIPLPRIVLRDIGTSKGGISPDEATLEIMSVVLRQVLGAVAKSPVKSVEGIKNIFGGGD